MKAKLSTLPKGEYIRLTENGPVWIKGNYDRSSKKFEIYKFDDVNHFSLRKGTCQVFHGFTY